MIALSVCKRASGEGFLAPVFFFVPTELDIRVLVLKKPADAEFSFYCRFCP